MGFMFNVPKDTTVNNNEYKPPKGAIGFAPELIDFILGGKKLSTYRYGDKYDYLSVGDTIDIQDSTARKTVCKAIVTDKAYTTFAQLPLKINIHESYKDKEHQRAVLSGYYAFLGRPLEDEDEFIKFEFELKEGA